MDDMTNFEMAETIGGTYFALMYPLPSYDEIYSDTDSIVEYDETSLSF